MNNPLLAFLVLAGAQWQDWEYRESDPGWWELHFWTRRN